MTTTTPASVLTNGADTDRTDADAAEVAPRDSRLSAGVDRLSQARRSLLSHPRLLVSAAAALMTSGICAVLLGWAGAANTTLIEEQVPYLISGGLLGLALATIGALLFFTHWLTVGIKEARQHEGARRRDHEELMEALRAIGDSLARQEGSDGSARGRSAGRPVRRAPRGS